MTKDVKYTISISVEDGPGISIPDVITTSNGYNVISKEIKKEDGEITINTQSGSKDKIDLLCIK